MIPKLTICLQGAHIRFLGNIASKTINFNDYLDMSFENNLHQYTSSKELDIVARECFFQMNLKAI